MTIPYKKIDSVVKREEITISNEFEHGEIWIGLEHGYSKNMTCYFDIDQAKEIMVHLQQLIEKEENTSCK